MKLADCHPNRKAQARGMCKSCYDKWLKETNPAYKQAQASNSTIWTQNNPDKAKVIQERRRAKELADPERPLKQRNKQLKKYGLDQAQYDVLLASQGGVCRLCTRRPGAANFHVDHNHDTGRVRGILCHQCNWYMGTIDADVTVITRIVTYLKEDGHDSIEIRFKQATYGTVKYCGVDGDCESLDIRGIA